MHSRPVVCVDLGGNSDRPDSPSEPLNQTMLFSRFVVANIAAPK